MKHIQNLHQIPTFSKKKLHETCRKIEKQTPYIYMYTYTY